MAFPLHSAAPPGHGLEAVPGDPRPWLPGPVMGIVAGLGPSWPGLQRLPPIAFPSCPSCQRCLSVPCPLAPSVHPRGHSSRREDQEGRRKGAGPCAASSRRAGGWWMKDGVGRKPLVSAAGIPARRGAARRRHSQGQRRGRERWSHPSLVGPPPPEILAPPSAAGALRLGVPLLLPEPLAFCVSPGTSFIRPAGFGSPHGTRAPCHRTLRRIISRNH